MSQLDAMRYAVLDAAEEQSATELWGHRGKLLDSFRTEDSAKALAQNAASVLLEREIADEDPSAP